MDRQAWIAIALCVLGLIGWYGYTATHLPPPTPVVAAPSPSATAGNSPAAATSPSVSVSPAPVSATSPSPAPAESVPTFDEKAETMTNGDVELHLTNRGGAIAEAVLLNHTVEGHRVVLNAPDRIPIGAIVDQPEAVTGLPEYSIAKQADGAIEFERKTPEGVTIRKRFFFPPTADKKDNFVAEMDVDFRNDGAH